MLLLEGELIVSWISIYHHPSVVSNRLPWQTVTAAVGLVLQIFNFIPNWLLLIMDSVLWLWISDRHAWLLNNADINECDEHNKEYPCRGVCENTPGSYECKCPRGTHSADPLNIPCNPNFPLAAKIVTGIYMIPMHILHFLLTSKFQ
jgi:hypothetical protein